MQTSKTFVRCTDATGTSHLQKDATYEGRFGVGDDAVWFYPSGPDFAGGGYSADRFRPLTRQEEEEYIRSRHVAAMADVFVPIPPVDISIPNRPDAPDGNPKTRFGLAKPSISLIPGPALVHMADAFRDGAVKYGPANWRDDPVSASTYTNAALRHLLSYWDGEDNAEDSGVHHLAHAAACLAIILDAEAQGSLKDDRPTAGQTSRLIKEKTRPLA